MTVSRVPQSAGPDHAREQPPSHRVTELLAGWSKGDPNSVETLFPLIYNELRRRAGSRLRRERRNHTLQVTGLVHEAYLRLVDQEATWQSRAHFFAIASEIMRRVLLDYAKQKQASKRGAGTALVSLDDPRASAVSVDANLLLIDEALTKLKKLDERAAEVVQMRFFGGLTNNEIAEALGISTATVQRQWMSAKAWLHHELQSEV